MKLQFSEEIEQHLIDQLPLQVRRDFRSLALIPVWSGLEWFGVVWSGGGFSLRPLSPFLLLRAYGQKISS